MVVDVTQNMENENKTKLTFVLSTFYLEFHICPKNVPSRSLEFDKLPFLLAFLYPSRKQDVSKNSQACLLTGISQ